jgi:uncharacterized protein (TIGR00730 family)
MSLDPKLIKKVLSNKVMQLNNIIADMDSLLTQMETDFFRVSIFGSARMKPETPIYAEICELAYQLALRDCDIVTGGGPGLMEASNKGAQKAGHKTRSIGLPIQLNIFESKPNSHLDVKREHRRFSSRLDDFMRVSHAVVVTPGGIGTTLELFYTWQLLQVHQISPRPILFIGDMWPELIQWMRKWPLAQRLMAEEDFQHVTLCKNVEEAILALEPTIESFHHRKTARYHAQKNP